jgi:hypothetical protein
MKKKNSSSRNDSRAYMGESREDEVSRKSGVTDTFHNESEESDESEAKENSESNLVDALSADEQLKREVSIEVDEEMRKEERINEVYRNSKEIQYSDQISEMGYDYSTSSIPKKSFASCIKTYKF